MPHYEDYGVISKVTRIPSKSSFYCGQPQPMMLDGNLTHRGWDKMAAALQTTFLTFFLFTENLAIRFKFLWNLFPMVQLTICQHWCRKWLGDDQATSHYLNQWSPGLLTHICVTWPLWVNTSQASLDCFYWNFVWWSAKCMKNPKISMINCTHNKWPFLVREVCFIVCPDNVSNKRVEIYHK